MICRSTSLKTAFAIFALVVVLASETLNLPSARVGAQARMEITTEIMRARRSIFLLLRFP
jgi:hypothetical protein